MPCRTVRSYVVGCLVSYALLFMNKFNDSFCIRRDSKTTDLGSEFSKQDTDMSPSSCVVEEGDIEEEMGIEWWK